MDNMIIFPDATGTARGGVAEVFGTWHSLPDKAEEPAGNAEIAWN